MFRFNLIISIILLTGSAVDAQTVSLRVLDDISGFPVEGVVVMLKPAAGRQVQALTDMDGRAQVTSSVPYEIWAQHLSYDTFYDSIEGANDLTIRLTPTSRSLDPVIITGQYSPQSVRQSVYDIRLVDRGQIERSGAVQLSTLLEKELNIRFSRDNATGSSGISLQGISGQNVKVLIDGVPMVGRSGVNNEIDLNQIDLQTVEQVEIVEGPMSVNYGADALAGVINIITRKDAREKLNFRASIHEETVANEYSWFDQGIHNPSLGLEYRLSEKFSTSIHGRVNRFGGWKGQETGRSHAWYPKTQYFGGGAIGFQEKEFSVRYSIEYLDETLFNYGPEQNNNPLKDPTATDEEYQTNRWMHQLQSDWKIGKVPVHTDLAYTDYNRFTHQFIRNLVTDEKISTTPSEQDTTLYNSFFFRNTFSISPENNRFSSQLGLDGTLEQADGTKISEGPRKITDIGMFGSVEWRPVELLKIRPGLRYTYNSRFASVLVGSVNIQWQFLPKMQWRGSYGRGYRAPSVRELFHEFIDTNHNIIGNPDLRPEYSHSVNTSLTYTNDGILQAVRLKGFFNYINDRITYVSTNEVNPVTTYANVEVYKTLGGSIGIDLQWRGLSLNTGVAVTGLYQALSEATEEVPEFVYTPEVNMLLSYEWKPVGLSVDANYKFNGVASRYILETDNTGDLRPRLGELDSFNLFDLSIRKSLGRSVTLASGIRNLFDVTRVDSTISSGTHGGGSSTAIGYGRSYFITINYQFKTN